MFAILEVSPERWFLDGLLVRIESTQEATVSNYAQQITLPFCVKIRER